MSNDLVKIPKIIVDQARDIQKRLRSRGINRPLWECILEAQNRRKKDDLWGSFRL